MPTLPQKTQIALTFVGNDANAPLTMSSLEISELTGSRHDNVKIAIERLAAKGVIEFPAMQEIPTATKPTKAYVFTGVQGRRDSIIVVAQLYPEYTARIVDRWQELETQVAAGPDLTTDEGKLLLIQDLAAKQLTLLADNKRIQLERDEAIRTKAQIGSKREATAMATAATKAHENRKLRALMGEATQSASVIAVQNKTGSQGYNWRDLKKYCTAAGLDMGKSFNPGLQMKVNTYPAQAWLGVYGIDLVELFGEVVA